jgi:uncharacterized protein
MRTLLTAAALALGMTFAIASPARADADPTVHQIYAAAQGGHLDQAELMISRVLTDHPGSAMAHYVQAEIYARQGKASLARSELATAEELKQLKPGQPFANPRSVQELKAQLGIRTGVMGPALVRQAPAAPRFPWGTLLIFAGAIGLLWMVFRRRNTYGQYPAAGPGMGGAPGPGGYGPGPMGGGIGSGIAGGLASGLAVGAGVVAGEELAHHFLDGGRGGVIPAAEAGESGAGNADMGGADFGANDPGSGWDDGGSGGGDWGGDSGGGGDWS